MSGDRVQSHQATRLLGEHIIDFIAPAVAAAIVALTREQRICDGFGERGASAGISVGPGGARPVESAVLASRHFALLAEDLFDALDGLRISMQHVERLARAAIGERAPLDVLRCKDGQVGRDAGAWSSDAQCAELPVKLGMCVRHYTQCYRYRVARRLDVSRYFEEGVPA